jgi:triose/dihydroxyacetone kinase / FAD-AMP lyase (cyclizing)
VLDYAAALMAGAKAVAEHGGASEGFRTMLDALMPAARAAEESANKGEWCGCCVIISLDACVQ